MKVKLQTILLKQGSDKIHFKQVKGCWLLASLGYP